YVKDWLSNVNQRPSLHRLHGDYFSMNNGYSHNYPPLYAAHQFCVKSADIQLSTLTYCDYIDVIVTIHHTDTVSVAVSCSFRPIAIDAKGIIQLSEALTRTETHIAHTMEKSAHSSSAAAAAAASAIPSYGKWIVKMWHFGVDTIDEYTGKEFEVTFEEGMADLYRIYTKRMKDGKNRVRVEHQEYPNQAFADAAVRKLFPDGQLVVPGDETTG
ncbi:MAG: hypothetical protein ACJ71X_06960, partial [Nitrososphaeraceae archaeon]